MHTNNSLALHSGLCVQHDNVIAYTQRRAKSSKTALPEIKMPLVFVLSDQSSFPVKKLSLHAMVLNNFTKRPQCITKKTVHITLDFVNGTMPPCAQTDEKELCFPHRDTSNPHIMENRFPGPFRQFRRLTRLNVCPNYTISYSVESGETRMFYLLREKFSLSHAKLKSISISWCSVQLFRNGSAHY